MGYICWGVQFEIIKKYLWKKAPKDEECFLMGENGQLVQFGYVNSSWRFIIAKQYNNIISLTTIRVLLGLAQLFVVELLNSTVKTILNLILGSAFEPFFYPFPVFAVLI